MSVCLYCQQLRSIERRHAIVEWSDRKHTYIVRDLGTPSGVGREYTSVLI